LYTRDSQPGRILSGLTSSRIRPSHAYQLAFALVILALLLAACNNSGSTTPSAQALIKSAQQAIQKVTAYHFNLQVQNPGPGGKLPITSADGDVKVPDRLKATATISGNAVQIIAIGDKQYINLLGGWQSVSGLLDPRALSDPKTGVSALLGHIQNPSQPADSSVNGTSCWLIKGKLDPSLLAGITGGGAPAGTLDNVSVCIGKTDNLPYQFVISGPAAAGDTSQTSRTITLSKFNESITINPPGGTSIV
jgi:hypothetical protein